MKHIFSFLCVGFGCLLFVMSGYLIWQRHTPTRLSFALELTGKNSQTVNTVTPIELHIPDLQIHLPVVAAKGDKTWDASSNGVSYLASSAFPGEVGNSIFYGHNWPNLLGELPNIKSGQEIQIVFDNNSKKTFIVEYTSVVTPNQIEVLKDSKDKRITLYTCSGFLDTKRFVATARLKES